MKYNTVYAIELNNKSFISEWNKEVRIMLEEAGLGMPVDLTLTLDSDATMTVS